MSPESTLVWPKNLLLATCFFGANFCTGGVSQDPIPALAVGVQYEEADTCLVCVRCFGVHVLSGSRRPRARQSEHYGATNARAQIRGAPKKRDWLSAEGR